MENRTEDLNIVGDVIPLKYIRNFPFPGVPWLRKEHIEASLDYKARDGDIILSAYPKTGNTWLHYIVWQILHKGEYFPSLTDMLRLVPFMEMSGVEAVESLVQPRFYKNHFPYNMMTINDKAKYLYIHRDPKDTLVSCYHFHHALGLPAIDFNTFFEAFLQGKMYYGDYFDHVLSLYPHRNDPHVLFLSYDELHKDTKNQILIIAQFLGENYFQMLKADEGLLSKILKVTSFDYMKKNLLFQLPAMEVCSKDRDQCTSDLSGEVNIVKFFRKGIVGDGKTFLSEEQIEKLRKRILEKMNGTDLAVLWSS